MEDLTDHVFAYRLHNDKYFNACAFYNRTVIEVGSNGHDGRRAGDLTVSNNPLARASGTAWLFQSANAERPRLVRL